MRIFAAVTALVLSGGVSLGGEAGLAFGEQAGLAGPPARMRSRPSPSGSGRVWLGIGAGVLAGAAGGAVTAVAFGEVQAAPAVGGITGIWTLPASITGAVVGHRGPAWAGALAGAAVETGLVAVLFAGDGSDLSDGVFLGYAAGMGALTGAVAATVAHERPLHIRGATIAPSVRPVRGRGVAGALRVTF